jgi:hypothetical protein
VSVQTTAFGSDRRDCYLNVVGEGDVVDPLAGRGVQIHLAIDAGVVDCIIATKKVQ